VHTGSPISCSNLTKSEAKQKLNISTQKPILLITGGSSGAKSINDFVFKNISNLTEKYYVIHLVGNGNLNKNITSKNYKQIEFSNDMKSLFKVADYAISRAGANTIFELLSNMVPTIFIPLPKGASRGDQIDNTNYLDSIDVSRTIHQENLSTQTLFKELDYLEKNAKTIKENIKKHNFIDGTEKIMQILLKEKIKH
jgi:UDP-N-acetylglucosamine--N-acetylmuramyl-(pentapeptide) pyrophosphoryl-undecaprenol N-acetylglucosamine transferase